MTHESRYLMHDVILVKSKPLSLQGNIIPAKLAETVNGGQDARSQHALNRAPDLCLTLKSVDHYKNDKKDKEFADLGQAAARIAREGQSQQSPCGERQQRNAPAGREFQRPAREQQAS